MANTTQFTIGAEVNCTDGPCGTVTRVIVDPLSRALTHLVVEPRHQLGVGRLVPLELASTAGGTVSLDCTLAEFDKLSRAEETEFLPGSSPGYAAEEVLAWPYYGLGGMGLGGFGLDGGLGLETGNVVVHEKVPLGEVSVRRGQPVHATDGEIGKVQGLVIDTSDHHVTHVLLQEGHLWGRKEVAIPIGAVAGTSDGIRLKITKQEVQDLPPVDIDRQNAE
jgi:sporulation protein YlmC with PRC-barrel domain